MVVPELQKDTASILVVDDDESNRESLRRRLERRGYKLSVAEDGLKALQMIEADRFDLIVLDVMMPGMSGLEVLDRLRKIYSPTELPIIMATAKDQSEDIVSTLERGANDYVTKPLDFAVVAARIGTQLLLKKSVDQIVDLERNLTLRNAELESVNAKLLAAAERTNAELLTAAKVQKAFLPRPDFEFPGVRFSWIFEPCTELAGDSLNIVKLDNDHVAFYLLDVSGHGIAASLLAVTAARLLSVSGNGQSMLYQHNDDGNHFPASPSLVLTRLSQQLSLDLEMGQFLTLVYAIYNVKSGELNYASAGHPPAICIVRGGATDAVLLNGTGMPIGVGDTFEHQTSSLKSGDRLYLYSDGVTEAMNPDRDMFGQQKLVDALTVSAQRPMADSISFLHGEIEKWQEGKPFKDDVSILGMEAI